MIWGHLKPTFFAPNQPPGAANSGLQQGPPERPAAYGLSQGLARPQVQQVQCSRISPQKYAENPLMSVLPKKGPVIFSWKPHILSSAKWGCFLAGLVPTEKKQNPKGRTSSFHHECKPEEKHQGPLITPQDI